MFHGLPGAPVSVPESLYPTPLSQYDPSPSSPTKPEPQTNDESSAKSGGPKKYKKKKAKKGAEAARNATAKSSQDKEEDENEETELPKSRLQNLSLSDQIGLKSAAQSLSILTLRVVRVQG